MKSDCFHFIHDIQQKPETRRGILSTVAQVFDLMGLISSITLRGKKILQETCRQKLEWDDPVGEDLGKEWNIWKRDITEINKIQVSRCLKAPALKSVIHNELHHFSDASEVGYGQCSLCPDPCKGTCSTSEGHDHLDPADKEVRRPKISVKNTKLTAKSDSLKIENFSTGLVRGMNQLKLIAKICKQKINPFGDYRRRSEKISRTQKTCWYKWINRSTSSMR